MNMLYTMGGVYSVYRPFWGSRTEALRRGNPRIITLNYEGGAYFMSFSLTRALKRALILTLGVCILWTGLYAPVAQAADETFSIIALTNKQISDGLVGVRVRVLDSNGDGVSTSVGQFSASVDSIPASVQSSAKGLDISKTGYIYVVDVSKYYVNSVNQVTETLTALLNAMMILLKDDDAVRFIWVSDTGEPEVANYVDPATARQMFTSNDVILQRYKASKGEDAALYDGINRAVQIALDPNDAYVFHQIVVISDCFNSRGTTGNTTLDSIRNRIAQDGPLPIWVVALENSNANANLKTAANANQVEMQNFANATGGSFCMMDYRQSVLQSNPAAAQAQEVLKHFSSLQQGNVNLIINLNEHLGEYDRTPGHISNLTITRDSRSVTLSSDLGLPALPAAPDPTEVPEAAATVSPFFATYGERDSANVRELQQFLTNLGYYSGAIDGNFNNATRLAYQAMCTANQMNTETTDGGTLYVSTERYLLLSTDTSLVTPTPVPTTVAPTDTPTPTPTAVPPYAAFGDRNSDNVRNLQELMAGLGYYEGEIDGNFGNSTRQAYQRLCEANDIPVVTDERGNVQVSEETYALIATDRSLVTPTPVPTTVPPTDTPSPEPTPVPPYAAFGDRNSENVRNLQELMARLGYYEGEVDGNFGNSTRQAYIAMCEANGLDTTTDDSGVLTVTQERYQMISSDMSLATAVPPTPTPKPEYIDLSAGQQDAADDNYIVNLQNRLRELNYYGDNAFTPGTYDDATVDAVKLFFDDNGLEGDNMDGTSVSANIQEQFIFSGSAKTYEEPEKNLPEKIRDFLSRELSIGSLNIPMWIIVVICAVLLLLILLLVIFIRLRSKQADEPVMDSPSDSTLSPNIPMGGSGAIGNDMPTAMASSTYGGNTVFGGAGLDAAGPAGGFGGNAFNGGAFNGGFSGDEATVSDGGFSGDETTVSADPVMPIRSVTLEISYNGSTSTITEQIDGLLTIGRKNCQVKIAPSDTTASRHHCDLFFDGAQLKVRNVSTSKTGTLLNGRPLTSAPVVTGEDSPTISFDDAFAGESGADAPVMNGDVLTVGRHKITVYYQN